MAQAAGQYSARAAKGVGHVEFSRKKIIFRRREEGGGGWGHLHNSVAAFEARGGGSRTSIRSRIRGDEIPANKVIHLPQRSSTLQEAAGAGCGKGKRDQLVVIPKLIPFTWTCFFFAVRPLMAK